MAITEEVAVPLAEAPVVIDLVAGAVPAGAGGGVPAAVDDIQDDLQQIDEEEVPLAVVGLDDEEDNTDGELEKIENEEVPLADIPVEAGRVWWSWIPVIGVVASAVDGYRRNKKEKEESADTRNED